MPRYRKSDQSKAKSVPVSLKPEHIKMLEYLEKVLKSSRSRILQHMIEEGYERYKHKEGMEIDVDHKMGFNEGSNGSMNFI